jgi:hypothetical protein
MGTKDWALDSPPIFFLGYVLLSFLYFRMGSHWHKITNGTINYMGLGIMIFRRGIDITWGIGWPVLGPGIALAYLGAKMPLGWRLVAFNGPNTLGRFQGPKQASNTPRNVNPPPKNHNAPPQIINSAINSYFGTLTQHKLFSSWVSEHYIICNPGRLLHIV